MSASIGEISALLTACAWTGSAMAFASATRRVGLFYVNLTRLIVALAILLLIHALFGLSLILTPRQILLFSLSGVIGFAVGDTFLFKAYQEIGARITMIIMSLSPAIAALLAFILLDEGMTAVGFLGMVLTLAGIVLVVADPGTEHRPAVSVTTVGLISAVMAAAGQGAGLVVAKLALAGGSVNGMTATGVRIIGALVPLVPASVITGRYRHPYRVFTADPRAWWLMMSGAVLGPVIGVTGSLIAIDHTAVGIAATIMAIVPILMLPMVRWIYKEHLTWRAIAGAVMAVAGVAVLFMR